ncbi:unnamed protein product [Mesocestoides corti]|uniref:CCR4-Not complex component Not1 C-terminal domain-containing protein n=1 Tax=Mesocestoides corti TaxID=53468 RepID=A0A3P6HZA8_MESCO|nr:unnamed protein product [Mesocestoides corti]
MVTVLRLTGFLLTFLIDNPGLYTSALAAATATTQATRGEHDGSEAVSQEAPPPPQGKKAGGQQANAAMLWSARATQHLATFGLAANLQYNVEFLMNVVLYFCITAVKRLRRCLLLNCMANQLRYPNSHTYYFSNTLLYLFAEQSMEQMKELISRVLMESGA